MGKPYHSYPARRLARRLRLKTVGVIVKPLVFVPFGYDREPALYIGSRIDFLMSQDLAPDLFNELFVDLLDVCRYSIELRQTSADLFRPGHVYRLLMSISSILLRLSCTGDERKILKANALLLALFVMSVVAAWRMDLSSKKSFDYRTKIGRLRSSCGIAPSSLRLEVEELMTFLSRSHSRKIVEELLCGVLFGDAKPESRELLQGARKGDPECLESCLMEIEALANRSDRLTVLTRHIVQAALESLKKNDEKGFLPLYESDLDLCLPFLSGKALAAVHSIGLMNGIGLDSLDSSAATRLFMARRQAGSIISRLPLITLSQEEEVLRDQIPVVYGGSFARSAASAQRLDLFGTLRLQLAQPGIPKLAVKELPLAKWVEDLPPPPGTEPATRQDESKMPALVLCIDSSGSTSAVCGDGRSVLDKLVLTAVCVEQFLDKCSREWRLPTPELITINFSDTTLVAGGEDETTALNLVRSQNGGTRLDVPKMMEAIPESSTANVLICTDGEIGDEQATAEKLLAETRIQSIHVVEVTAKEDGSSQLTAFSSRLVNSSSGKARVHKASVEEQLTDCLISIIDDLYQLKGRYRNVSKQGKSQTGSLEVCQ